MFDECALPWTVSRFRSRERLLEHSIIDDLLPAGTIEVHLRHLLYGEAFEVDTPNLALTLGAGEYRIEVTRTAIRAPCNPQIAHKSNTVKNRVFGVT